MYKLFYFRVFASYVILDGLSIAKKGEIPTVVL